MARQRRLQLARMLIDQTSLPMIDVASASGFSSLRRFNSSVRSAFGRSPTELRRSARPRPNGVVALRLPYRPPLAWESLLGFLAARAVPGVEEVRDGTYRRTIGTEAGGALVEISPIEGTAGAGRAARASLRRRSPRARHERARRLRSRRGSAGDPRLARRARAGRRRDFAFPARWIRSSLRSGPCWASRSPSRRRERSPAGWSSASASLSRSRAVGSRTSSRRRPRSSARHRDDRAARSAGGDDSAAGARGRGRRPRPRADLRARRSPSAAARHPRHRALDGRVRGHAGHARPGRLSRRRSRLRHALAANGRPASAAEVEQRSTAWRPWRAYAAVHLWESLAVPSRARHERLVYAHVETPIGRLIAAATDDGLVRLSLPGDQPGRVLGDLEEPGRSPGQVARGLAGAVELDEYFAGERDEFTMPLDMGRASGFAARRSRRWRASLRRNGHVHRARCARGNRGPPAQPATRARRTRSRSSFPAIGCSARTAACTATRAAWTSRSSCCGSKASARRLRISRAGAPSRRSAVDFGSG